MNRALVVVVVLSCAALGMPQASSAAGSYGAVVEKGVRDCATEWESGVVICFESPSANYLPHGAFLKAWHAAHFYLARSDTSPATVRVRAVSVSVKGLPGGRPVLTYLARADLVMSDMACREDLQFQASNGDVQLESLASACEP